jgi:hypothetical protein
MRSPRYRCTEPAGHSRDSAACGSKRLFFGFHLKCARSRLGENDYRLLTNICEHVCNWCRSGVSRSEQVERRPTLRFVGALFHA